MSDPSLLALSLKDREIETLRAENRNLNKRINDDGALLDAKDDEIKALHKFRDLYCEMAGKLELEMPRENTDV